MILKLWQSITNIIKVCFQKTSSDCFPKHCTVQVLGVGIIIEYHKVFFSFEINLSMKCYIDLGNRKSVEVFENLQSGGNYDNEIFQ